MTSLFSYHRVRSNPPRQPFVALRDFKLGLAGQNLFNSIKSLDLF